MACLVGLLGLGGCVGSSPREAPGRTVDLAGVNQSPRWLVRIVYTTNPGVTSFTDLNVNESGQPVFLQDQQVRELFVGANERSLVRLGEQDFVRILAVQFYTQAGFQDTFRTRPVRESAGPALVRGTNFTGGVTIQVTADDEFRVIVLTHE